MRNGYFIANSRRAFHDPLPVPKSPHCNFRRDARLINQGFVSGWLCFLAWAINAGRYAVVFSDYLGLWTEMTTWKVCLAITGFVLIPPAVNNINVRAYGEIEFWLTLFKILGIAIVILAGFVIVAGGTGPPLLGLDASFRPVPCSQNAVNFTCVSPPGFNCSFPQFPANG